MSSNRRANASRRRKGIYTRQELIKKHGLATFHPDPEENRKLQETKGKSIDFTGNYTNSAGTTLAGAGFLATSTTGGIQLNDDSAVSNTYTCEEKKK